MSDQTDTLEEPEDETEDENSLLTHNFSLLTSPTPQAPEPSPVPRVNAQ